jgi:histidine triad (HIT) family protein
LNDDRQLKLFGENRESTMSEVDSGCPFCSIARGETKRLDVFSDDISIAFLDRKPVFLGHCLVIPKNHYETLSDLPSDLLGQFFTNVQLLSKAVQKALDADGSFVAMNNRVSQSVPHLHVHVVPRKMHDGLRGFFWPRVTYGSESEAAAVREKIRDAVSYFTANQNTKNI